MEPVLTNANGVNSSLVARKLKGNDTDTLFRNAMKENAPKSPTCEVGPASARKDAECPETLFGNHSGEAELDVDSAADRRRSVCVTREHDESLDTLPPMRQKSNSVPDTKALLSKRVERTKPKPLHRRDTPMDFSWIHNTTKASETQRKMSNTESVSEEDELRDTTALEADDKAKNGAKTVMERRQHLTRQDTPASTNLEAHKIVCPPSKCDAVLEADEKEDATST